MVIRQWASIWTRVHPQLISEVQYVEEQLLERVAKVPAQARNATRFDQIGWDLIWVPLREADGQGYWNYGPLAQYGFVNRH